MDWFMLLWGAAALAHGAALATNVRGYADKCLRLMTGGVNPQSLQHFNAAAGQWRVGRAGLTPNVPMLRVIGGILAVAGAVALGVSLAAF